jgi:hypothetical protein
MKVPATGEVEAAKPPPPKAPVTSLTHQTQVELSEGNDAEVDNEGAAGRRYDEIFLSLMYRNTSDESPLQPCILIVIVLMYCYCCIVVYFCIIQAVPQTGLFPRQ